MRRYRLTNEHLERVVELRRQYGHGYTLKLAEEYGVRPQTVEKWVIRARRRGLLEPWEQELRPLHLEDNVIDPDTRAIPLTNGLITLVDAADYENLAQFRWFSTSLSRTNIYAVRTVRGKTEFMHRRLLPGHKYVDHINGNGLDNRRSNLRPATNSENIRNRRRLNKNNTSGYIGVTRNPRTGRWRAQIRLDGRSVQLGEFDDREHAARVRDAAARKHFGEFASLNFPDEETAA